MAILHRMLVCLCLAAFTLTASAQDTTSQPTGAETPLTQEARQQAINQLRPRHLDWLRSVRGLISQPELDYFLRVTEDFRRDLFIRAFWEPRDPNRQTTKNELKERWERFRSAPGGLPFGDPRFMLLLLNGPPGGWLLPDGRPVARCYSRSKELEIWFYGKDGVSERTNRRFPVILQQRAEGQSYEIYLPGQGIRPIQRSGGRLPSTNIHELCAEELLRYTEIQISRIGDYDQLLREVLSPPLPSPEWLANLAASATDLPPGAETFEIGVQLDYPTRKQSRTAVRVMLGVTRDAAPGRRFPGGEQTQPSPEGEPAQQGDGELFHHFQLVGEVIRDGQLFESFRYRFEGPTPDHATMVPLGFTRYLRAGPTSLRLLIEDVYGGRFARVVREIEIPSPEGLPPVAEPTTLAQAENPALRLYPPRGSVHVGKVRFRARANVELEKVTFFLDERPVLSKRRPPYSVEIDLGDAPEPHRVRVVGFAGDAEVATDQIWLNQGAQRFRTQLIEPRPGGIYPGSVTARVQVDTPDDKPPERLELFLGDELVATLRKPPFSHGMTLPPNGNVAVVRAVAYLADGTASEDAVVIGATAFTDVIDVRWVELPVLVTGTGGEPITGLEQERFRVFDDGAPRRIERFEPASEAPITAAVLIDRSVSMAPHLTLVADAARAFTAAVVRAAEDRVAVFSFADDLTVDAGFTAGAGERERALAGLDALGGTAFYDGLVQAFNTFEGMAGAPALILFTDGRDETSQLTLEQTLDAARRAGVRLFCIGLEAAFPEKTQRRIVEQLADETGGRAIFLSGLDELTGVYLRISEELRAGYLIAYQAPSAGADSTYRKIKVEVDDRRARVRTRSGYYP